MKDWVVLLLCLVLAALLLWLLPGPVGEKNSIPAWTMPR